MAVQPTDYLKDLLDQPESLRQAATGFDPELLRPLQARLASGEFERVILTGMGASLFAAYPAWLALVQAGLPAFWLDTGELFHSASRLATPGSLLWIVSNSGRSIEIAQLLERLSGAAAPAILAVTGDPASLLGQRADCLLPLHTADDRTPLAQRSYTASLAVCQLAARQLAARRLDREDIESGRADLLATAEGLRAYLADWEERLAGLETLLGRVERLGIVGRGVSYASALEGALCFKEGAKFSVEGLTSGQFWHGPVELLDGRFTLLALGGPAETQAAEAALAQRAAGLGAKVLWLGEEGLAGGLPRVELPAWRGIGLPQAEIVPLQLLTYLVGQQTGFQPGEFRYITHSVSTRIE
jgi:glucosamine--fructose-6-phosphate aminotransferase (isomerizing)